MVALFLNCCVLNLRVSLFWFGGKSQPPGLHVGLLKSHTARGNQTHSLGPQDAAEARERVANTLSSLLPGEPESDLI